MSFTYIFKDNQLRYILYRGKIILPHEENFVVNNEIMKLSVLSMQTGAYKVYIYQHFGDLDFKSKVLSNVTEDGVFDLYFTDIYDFELVKDKLLILKLKD